MNVSAQISILNLKKKKNAVFVIILGLKNYFNLLISETCSIPLEAGYCLICNKESNWYPVYEGDKIYCECPKGYYEDNQSCIKCNNCNFK